jgi:hypothetical protein
MLEAVGMVVGAGLLRKPPASHSQQRGENQHTCWVDPRGGAHQHRQHGSRNHRVHVASHQVQQERHKAECHQKPQPKPERQKQINSQANECRNRQEKGHLTRAHIPHRFGHQPQAHTESACLGENHLLHPAQLGGSRHKHKKKHDGNVTHCESSFMRVHPPSY